MSDVDTLIVMFQTQLSDVMDTLVKTAMRELTRLVEDGFVEEVRRRTRDAESLRAQLQWAEKKLSDAAAAAAQAGEEAPGPAGSGTSGGRCVDCGKALCRGGGGTTGEAAEEEEEEEEENIATELLQYGVLIGCDMKQEDDAMELCTGSHGQEVMSELAQEADVPVLVLSPVRESATMEQATARPVVDVKKEEVNEPSCSAEHAGDWPVSHDVGSESHHGMGEWTDAQQQQLDHQTQQSSIEEEEEELLRTIIRQEEEEDPLQTTPVNTHTRTSEDLRENEAQRALYACMLTDEPSDIVSPYDMDSGAQQVTSSSTLRPTLRHSAQEMGANGCETAPKQTPIVSVRVRGRDHISSSDPPPSRARQQFPLGGDVGTVVIKEEIIVNSDEGEEEMEEMVMMTTRPGLAAAPPPSFTVNQYAPGAPAQGEVSRKPTTAKEATKLHHSKVGSSTTLKAAAVQHQHHQHQTAKKPNTTAHSLLASSSSRRTVSSSDAHSQAANQLNLQHRTPSTMSSHKGIGPPPLLTFQTRAQTNEPTNKRVLALTRASSIPWVSIKTHHHHHQQQQQSSALHSQQNLLHHHHGGGTTTTHSSSGSSSPHNNTSSHLLRCGQCGKCFPHPSNLKAHVQTHTGERPFCCSLCGRSFTKLSNLKAHRRVHTGERPYCCLACGKRFTQKCNLKRHQRVHIDV